ncbi:N,N-dimethylaniline monooxygenase [Aureococcus anophagefferens]|nr:N,N-dimethylaniline monooxygenase [Aureococcus anophagefferens]
MNLRRWRDGAADVRGAEPRVTVATAEAPAAPTCGLAWTAAAAAAAAYFLKKFGLDHAVVDAADGPGSFFRKYPVGRQLISINKRHLPDLAPLDEAERADFALRHDWNSLLSDERAPLMRDFSEAYYPAADDLVRYLEAFEARHAPGQEKRAKFTTSKAPISAVFHSHALDVVYGAKALSVDRRAGGGFDVRIGARGAEVTIRAQIVLVAAGLAKQAPPDLPAFEVAGLLRDYAAQTYVIPRTDPEFAHESHYPGAARPGVVVDRARARRRRGPRRRRSALTKLRCDRHGARWPRTDIAVGDFGAAALRRASSASAPFQCFGVLCDLYAFSGDAVARFDDVPYGRHWRGPNAVRHGSALTPVAVRRPLAFADRAALLAWLDDEAISRVYRVGADGADVLVNELVHPVFRFYDGAGALRDVLHVDEELAVFFLYRKHRASALFLDAVVDDLRRRDARGHVLLEPGDGGRVRVDAYERFRVGIEADFTF